MGLGNPGAPYASTRHNVGFWVLDALAAKTGVSFRKPFFSSYQWAEIDRPEGRLLLVKPLTYMNRSGEILADLQKKFSLSPDTFLVVADQLDLPPGTLRLKSGGGTAGHNGLKSIELHAGTSSYKRLYVGIGRPEDGQIIPWVLGVPEKSDAEAIFSAVNKAATHLETLVSTSWDRLISLFNAPQKTEPS